MIRTWEHELASEYSKPYFKELMNRIESERFDGKTIFPSAEDIFSALELTPFEKVRVVVLGQDPYHGLGQAHGLAFSVRKGVRPPPSLVNIFKELKTDLGIMPPAHGILESWAKEGVLLLNSVLTVEQGRPAGHNGWGWEKFTDKIIDCINRDRENVVFILWGVGAQKKAARVDRERHLLISSPHPSPLSCYRGFFGSKPFSRANEYLVSKRLPPINWAIAE